jgi:uncharacterized protein YndB with AHSA1/START domain
MHGPDGTDYENTTQHLEVEPQARLVYDHGGHGDRPPLFRVTALFAEQDGRTRADITPGGSAFFVITGEHGTMHVRSDYLAVDAPHRIVYAQQFCDEHQRPSLHPGAETFPAALLTTVTLVEEGTECTRVTVTMEPQGSLTEVELAAFVQERGGMTQGWTGSFDALEALLS